jgi:hypothetical protein
MAAPLNTCTTIEQRGVRFLWAKNMEAKDIQIQEMLPMLPLIHYSLNTDSASLWFYYTDILRCTVNKTLTSLPISD